jgi:hypothetical protein
VCVCVCVCSRKVFDSGAYSVDVMYGATRRASAQLTGGGLAVLLFLAGFQKVRKWFVVCIIAICYVHKINAVT